jgi:hypothetical protein
MVTTTSMTVSVANPRRTRYDHSDAATERTQTYYESEGESAPTA